MMKFPIKTLIFLSFFANALRNTSEQSTGRFSENWPDLSFDDSGTRLAYYRWRSWLLDHPAIRQKVPPIPKKPGLTAEDKLNVSVKVTPATVLHVDQAQQTVHLSAKMQFWWIDPILAVTDHLDEFFTDGNVSLLPESVTIPSDLLWLPPLVMAERISALEVLREVNEVEVKKNGQILIELPYVITFSCRFDMSGYPFDEHDCSLTLVDTSGTANVRPSETPWDVTLSQTFGVEGEWELVDVVENVQVFGDTGQSYAQCVLRLRRKTTFYVVLMIVPMVMTSYLNVLVFLLPHDLGDKASYLVTVLISTSFFASFFNANMPRGINRVPGVVWLYVFVMAESCFALLTSLIILRKYKSEESRQEKAEIISNSGTMSFVSEYETLGITSKTASHTTGFEGTPRELNAVSDEVNDTIHENNIGTSGEHPFSGKVVAQTKHEVSSKSMPAKNLDTVLFVVVFTANTIAIMVILVFMV